MDPETLRGSIPALEEVTYLNTGASGPSPRPVVEAAQESLAYQEYEAHAREGIYEAAFGAYDETREAVAAHLGATPDEIALTQSTADGIAKLAGSLDWEPGDVVVRTDLEHPAGVLPWQRLERSGVETRVVGSTRGRIDRDSYRDAVSDADLVCFSAISWNYGTRLPVRDLVEIASDAGALTLVDAVQAVGQTAVDVEDWGADIVAASGHKWLLGTWGAGMLYVRDEVADRLEPGTVGYRSVVDPDADEYRYVPGARRFEIGTTSPAPYVALREAIATIEAVGLDAIETRIERLADRLTDGVPGDRLLSPREPESGLVTIEVEDPEATVDRLANEGIAVRSLPDPPAIRASVHAFNTEADVEDLLTGLAETERW